MKRSINDSRTARNLASRDQAVRQLPPAYRTITGRHLDLSTLSRSEIEILREILNHLTAWPTWNAFSSWWPSVLARSGLSDDSPIYRVCQDMEARFGISCGKVALPDYRDYLADLIEVTHGSRYRFCKTTGVDPAHLSRVLAGSTDLSVRLLQGLLASFGVVLTITPVADIKERVSSQSACASLKALLREVDGAIIPHRGPSRKRAANP